MNETTRKNLFEFLRYAVVGGISALIDMGVLWAFTELVFDGINTGWRLAISVAMGFAVGLAVNYGLSILFVFIADEQKSEGKNVKAFIIYLIIGLIGFGMTELFMFLGMLFVPTEGLWYLVLNVFVKGVVLVWNYIGRKIFVYHGH